MVTVNAVVVYESMFGNTKTVAEAVADGIREGMPVDVVEVGAAAPLQDLDVDLLVVGAPTHAFGLSRPQTRRDAVTRAGGAVISSGPGVREWLDAADRVRLPIAAFDTHTKKPYLPGHAGRVVDRRLRGLGCTVLSSPESFLVNGYDGPLCAGELERAKEWGSFLARLATQRGARESRA